MLSDADKKRIQDMQKGRWLPHPFAKKILTDLELILNQPKIDGAPMGKAVIGRSGSGKTTVLKHFVHQHLTSADSALHQPIYVNVPSGPNLNALLISILEAVNDFKATARTAGEKEKRIKRILSNLEPSIIIFDEAQNLAEGTSKQTRNCFNAIKSISNELSIPTVLAGTDDLIPAIGKDEQYMRRWRATRLETYSGNNQAFVELVNVMVKGLGLKNQEFPLPKTVYVKIHNYSDGVIGLVKELLINAAIQAIEDKSERIKVTHINPL